ncbi:MAG: hypothetical protein QOG46_759 [Pseudonocardiales bacterium]|jgi:hypothetical protein|nr:hypothetical protein [Pseudonocardiales bacterium]
MMDANSGLGDIRDFRPGGSPQRCSAVVTGSVCQTRPRALKLGGLRWTGWSVP